MSDKTHLNQSEPNVVDALDKDSPAAGSKHSAGQGRLALRKIAATQAAGDGIQGDTLQKDKTVEEKIGANMADRK